jgi:hypothetical protein
MLHAIIVLLILAGIITGGGTLLAHVLLGLFEIGSRFCRVIDRTSDAVVIGVAFLVPLLLVVMLALAGPG